MSQNQEHLKALRFELPQEHINDIIKLRIIGKDILVYCLENKTDEIKKSLIDHGFNIVEREYKVHVSARSKEDFMKSFGNIKYDDRSNGDKFIATVTAENEEEYNKYLDIGKDRTKNCLVKPYKPKFAQTQKSENNEKDVEHKQINEDHEQKILQSKVKYGFLRKQQPHGKHEKYQKKPSA